MSASTKVFVHGNPETSAIWSLLVAELHKRGETKIVLLTPPGFGAPTPAGWGGTMREYQNWLITELSAIEGEIDLVSLSADGAFHFIEVKTRSSLAFGHPFEAINREKAHRMQRLAMGWLATHGCLGCEYSIDVVAILIASDGSHTLEYRGNLL